MTDDDLKRIASTLGLSLPQCYQRLMREWPGTADATLRDDSIFAASPDEIIALNQEVRSVPLAEPDGEEFEWPEFIFAIGETDGDYFCIDVRADDPEVVLFDHQEADFFEFAESLPQFVEMLRNAIE